MGKPDEIFIVIFVGCVTWQVYDYLTLSYGVNTLRIYNMYIPAIHSVVHILFIM